uniref:Diaminopimelate decarboxylase n=1 Tax=Paulinella longichromatophora TaxID=1708747 RepID=A0A2H4ZQD2_9EUKA|nr:diaminopimelate decarboxylase [Paulinella longichromatophora]
MARYCGDYSYSNSPNQNLTPFITDLDKYGRLEIGGCCLSSLAHQYGTPLYVLDEMTLRAACRAYRDSLINFYPGTSLPLYASKANSCKAVSAIVASEGLGWDAVSSGEVLTALQSNMPTQHILLHGNNKSLHELNLALEYGITIVVDNIEDLQTLAHLIPSNGLPASIVLRVAPGIECHTHEYIRTGRIDSKFGLNLNEIESILRWLSKCSWAQVTGLHAHIGSQIFELKPHYDLVGVMLDIIKMARAMGHPLVDLNIGGGLGIRYTAYDRPPSIQSWVKSIARAVVLGCKDRCLNLPRLLCEPGRSVIATAGVTLYTLGKRKEILGRGTYMSVDGGMSDNPRPITYQSIYTACLADKSRISPKESVTLVGKHCESGDILLKDLDLPLSEPGDILVVFSTGAYNMSMSSNYNRIPRPSTVLVLNGKSDLIQIREQPDDLLRYDTIPPRLSKLC